MKSTVKKYTVEVTKDDGAKSKYFVLATSAGGAENKTLGAVYAARYALAVAGWPKGVKPHNFDLITDAAVLELI